MTDKPKALRLADALDDFAAGDCCAQRTKAAAELRQLQQEHDEDQRVIAVWRGRTQRAEAQRDALLGLCQELVKTFDMLKPNWANDEPSLIKEFRAAIARAEGSQT